MRSAVFFRLAPRACSRYNKRQNRKNRKRYIMLDTFDLSRIVPPLQAWFAAHARVLPWRETPTPYRVWISEIMLQQTRVEAVKPYYERFLAALPTVRDLAQCPDDRLMKLWEGLGYYNRARNLKTAANQILDDFDGQIPHTFEELLTLKGIGPYTAGAIASIACGQRVPAVDGNVLRVLSRLSADDSDIMKQSVRTHMEARLRTLMEQDSRLEPRAFNQALMELGAMVCVPNGAPLCAQCPLADLCEARKTDRIAELPVKSKAKKRRIEPRTVLVVRDGGRVAIHKRPNKGLLAGLYELPNREGYLTAEEVTALVAAMGYAPLKVEPLDDAKHIFSHVEWQMKGWRISVEDRQMDACNALRAEAGWQFVDAAEVDAQYAIPSAFSAYSEYIP